MNKNKNSKSKKRNPPKVKLSMKKVYILTATIFLVCVTIIGIQIERTESQPKEKEKISKEEKKPTAKKTEATGGGFENLNHRKPSVVEPAKTETEKTSVVEPVVTKTAKPSVVEPVETLVVEPVVTKTVKPSVVEPAVTKSLEQTKPFDIPSAVNNATIMFVIDDAGRSAEKTRLYAQLPFPLTIAVLPQLPQTKECAEEVRKGGKELILHQPMQAINQNLDPGPGAIRMNMSDEEIEETIEINLSELGFGVKGMNNHEGSLITSDFSKIGKVLDVCKKNQIYFLDSRTTKDTQAPMAALSRGMEIWEKAGPYIDNEINREKMLARIYETLNYANKNGLAIVIAHVDKSASILPELLREMYPYLKEAGYKFASPSMME